jgi:vacuolar protein sorting-associated protein 13A/C
MNCYTLTSSFIEKGDDESSGLEDSVGIRFATRIAENLQIEINDVHIRYEDNTTDPNCPFVFGCTLESISGRSTDKFWNPAWIENSPIIHKVHSQI